MRELFTLLLENAGRRWREWRARDAFVSADQVLDWIRGMCGGSRRCVG